jgi:Trk K+ transport system NAD-binding subunit
MRVDVPPHLVGKPVASLGAQGKLRVVAVDRGGRGFIPGRDSTFQGGDVAHIIVHHDALDTVDELLAPPAEG